MNTCTIQLTEQTALVLQGYRCVLSRQHTCTLKILTIIGIPNFAEKKIPILLKKGFVMKNDKPLNYKQCVEFTLLVTIIAIMVIVMFIIRTIKEFYYELLFLMFLVQMVIWYMVTHMLW